MKIDVYHHFPSDPGSPWSAILSLLNQMHEELHTIMANDAELVAQLNAVNTTLTDVAANVDKIGTETDLLLVKITELENALANAGNSSPEVDAALAAVTAQAGVVQSKVQGVDAKVPDAPPPEPTV
jgi:hypothetical protein